MEIQFLKYISEVAIPQLEEKYDITILFASDCGSRAYGWENCNGKSDYDIHMIFLPNDLDFYLTILEDFKRDELSWEDQTIYNGDVEVNWVGWNVQHAMSLIRRNNPAVIHALSSPNIYFEYDKELIQLWRNVCKSKVPKDALLKGMIHVVKANVQRYIIRKEVRKKKEFRVKMYVYFAHHILYGQCVVRNFKNKSMELPSLNLLSLLNIVPPPKRIKDLILHFRKIKMTSDESDPKVPRNYIFELWVVLNYKLLYQQLPELKNTELITYDVGTKLFRQCLHNFFTIERKHGKLNCLELENGKK